MKVKYIIAVKEGNAYVKDDTLYCARALLWHEDTVLAYPYTKSVFKLIDVTPLTIYLGRSGIYKIILQITNKNNIKYIVRTPVDLSILQKILDSYL